MNNNNKFHNCTDIIDIRFLFQFNVGYRKLRHFQVLCNVHHISSRVAWIPSVVHICSLIPICSDEKQKVHSSSKQGFQSHKTKEQTLIFSSALLLPTPIHSRKREHEPLPHLAKIHLVVSPPPPYPPPPKNAEGWLKEKLEKMGTQFGGWKIHLVVAPKLCRRIVNFDTQEKSKTNVSSG